MGTGTKYGKHCTNNINNLILVFIALFAVNYRLYSHTEGNKETYIIVIDPGHGGRDPGAVGSSSYEKNITLAIALKTGEYIEKNMPEVKVIYTRKTDIAVDLDKRSEMANKNNGNLFISIHANSIAGKNHNAYGTETYVMGYTKDQANLDVAMKENQVILREDNFSARYENFDPKSPESYIMFSLIQNSYFKQSTELASFIQHQYKDQIKRFDRGVQQAGFWVLYKTAMPSVLTEIGFISNPAEEKYMNSQEGQDNIAASIYRACKEYIDELKRKSVIPGTKPDIVVTPVDSTKTAAPAESRITFMIQIATSPKKIEIKPSNFKNIKDITQVISGNRYKYATGMFDDYTEAVRYRKEIEKIYPDAFVIAVKDNKILPLPEAIDLTRKKK
jgi:N-acetylmuramoyl-L-alanine amidase